MNKNIHPPGLGPRHSKILYCDVNIFKDLLNHSVLQKPCHGKKVSEALERKCNNLEPFTTLFNRLFEEIISLRSYVNEQLENIKKSPYDSKQSAKYDLTNYNTYVKRIDLKQKLLNCFQKTFLRGAMK